MEAQHFQELRAGIGYPNVSPWLGGWEDIDSSYTPTEYVSDSVKRSVVDWESMDLDLVWERAKKLSLASRILVRDTVSGRPLNPNGPTNISGFGKLRTYGPNLSADGIVLHHGKVLLIERKDTGQLAYPGGYRNFLEDLLEYEDPITAALREVKEETGLEVVGETKIIDQGIPPIVVRNTDNAWIEDSAVLVDISDTPEELLVPTAGDDAKPNSARWVPISEVETYKMSPRHAGHLRKIQNYSLNKVVQRPVGTLSELLDKR